MSRHIKAEMSIKAREAARREYVESFHAGTLAALDVVFLHDQPVIAAEIVNATDHNALWRHARREGYYNLAKLSKIIHQQNGQTKRGRLVTPNKKSAPEAAE